MDDSGVLSIINQVTGQGQAATAALPAVLSQAAQSGTSPDQEAEWQRLAKESNVPVGLIRNGAPVKLMQLQQQAADLPATNPVTARTLMDPDNAAVAHDDIGTLTRLEDLAKTGFGNNSSLNPQPSSGSTALQFGTPRDQAEANYLATEYGTKPFQAIQGGVGKLATKLAFPVAGALDAINGDDDYKEFASRLYDQFSAIQKQSAAAPDQGFGGKLFRSLEELAPMVLSGGFGLGSIVGQAVNDKYDDLTGQGVDPDTATALALKAGMSAYAMTKLPFGGTSLGNSLARGAVLNPAFGVLDRALDKAALNYVGDDKQADAINLMDPEQIAHEMALGLVFGAQHAIETGRPIVGNSVLETLLPFYDQYQAGRRADALTEIGKVVQDSRVNNRAPDLVQQHLSDVAADHAGIDNAYVPVDRWNELFQSAGLDPGEVANEMLSNPEAYHEANKTGSDIVIPFGEFTGKLSGLDQYGELVKDTKLSLGDMSLREAEAHAQAVKDNADNGGGFIDTLKNMFARSQEAVKGNESYSKVYDDLVGQQLDIGTERSTAEHNAQLVANAFRVLGDRAGVDPFELYSNYNLKLARPVDSALTDRVSIDTSILNQKNIADAKENISELYDLAIGTTNENRKIDIAPVPAWKVKAVADAVAIDGYRHQVDAYSIRHTLRQHGDSVREQKRGQLQITKDDILSIPETVLSPDSIAYGVKNNRGQDLIASVKRMPDGTLLVVEEARTGRKTLSMASVRKYPAAKDSDSVARTLLSNARSDGGNPNIRIVHPGDNVKSLFQTVAGHLAADGVRDPHQGGSTWSPEELMQKYNTDEQSYFGPVWRDLAHNDKGAIERLTQHQTGEAIGALHHPDVGDIDLVWGKEGTGNSDGYGLAKILKYHPEVTRNLQDILSDMKLVSKSENRAILESEKYKAIVRLEWNGRAKQWLLTAFQKRTGDKTTTDTLALTGKDDTASPPTDSSLDSIIKSKPSDVNTLLQSAVNHLADDGARDLNQSGNVPVSHDFVKNAEGRYAFGEITPEIGRAIGRESAPILLRNGNDTEGLAHIEERHKKDYEALGYNSAVDFVQDIIRHAEAVYQAKEGALDLVVTSGKLKFARAQLEPHEGGSYYDIKTATPGRSDQYKNKQPLWENAGPSASTEEYQSPLIPGANAAAFETILHQDNKNVKHSKPSDVNTLLQSAVNHLAADGVKELYQSEKPPVSEIAGKKLSDHLDSDNVITKARKYFRENLQGRVISRDGFGDVRVSDKGWEKVKWGLKTDLLKAQLIPAIPDIIKNGEYHGREELYKERKDDVVAFHFFTGDVLLDGKRVKAGLTVAEDSRGNLLYNINHDPDALWAKLKAPRLPGSEAWGAEPSRGDESSTLKQSIPNMGDHVNIKIIDNDQKEASASTTPPNSDDHVKKVVTGVLHSAITRIKTPADAAHIAFPLTKRAQEAAIAIVTDAKGNVLGVIQHSTGALDTTAISPRDLLGVVHDFPGAAEVWFAHNHPSGDPTTSPADREITSWLAALLDGSGIKSRGMIVVGQEGGAVWTRGKGDRCQEIPLSSLNTDKERNRKIKTYDREIVKLPSSERFFDVKNAIAYARLFGDGDSGIIILDAQAKPVSFVPMSVAEMAKLKTGDPATGSSAIMSAFHKGNGTSMIMIVPALPGSQAAARNMTSFGAMFGAPLSDVIYTGNGLSFRNTGRMPEASNRFFQGGDDKRGYIRFDNTRNFEIGLLKDANLSTFIHESGHFFTEVLGDLAERPDAPKQIKDDYAALLKFAGVESRDAIRTEHHEKLARAFEAYIKEGSAPSVEMHSVFQRMKAWMISVYKDMTALNVQLNPEIRDVFDRMLATDTEIERMRDMEAMKPLFATAEDAGMSQTEFDLYRKDAEQASELAKEQLLRKLMAEKSREQMSWWKDDRKKTCAEVEDEAKADPVYQTYQALTTGKTFDGRAVGNIKLSREALVKQQYGEAFVKKLPREFQRIYAKEGGLHPDAVAEMAGFGSGDEMVRKMAAAPKMKDYVKAETDQRMSERYGDMMTDGSIHEQALNDVHNDAQGKVMRAELRAIRCKAKEVKPFVDAAKKEGKADADATARWYTAEGRAKDSRDHTERNAMLGAIPPIEFFRMAASDAMEAKRVADIQPHLYAYAARAAARESFEATAKGDYEKAGAAKYRELLNHYLYKEAAKTREFADKVQAYAARMGTMKELGKFGQAGGQFLDQIRAILDRYSFDRISNKEADERLQHREPLDAFLRRMKHGEGVELPIPDAVRQEIRHTNYRNLSMDELREVYDSMRMLEHAARQVNQVNAEGRKVEVTQAALSMSNKLFRSIKGSSDLERKSDGAASLLDRVKAVNPDIPVWLPEFMFERFDGMKKAGPWHEFIWDRYNDAVNHQFRLREQLFPKIMEYAHANAIDRSMGKIHIDALNADLVTDDIIAIALNCGNESNLDKLMRGGLRFKGDEAPTPLNHEALQEILSHLSAKEIDVVNGIWKTIDLLKPEAAELARKRTGVEPNWIDALPMQVKNGTLEGGYYPVKYDPRYSGVGEKQADSSMLDQMFNKYASSSTRQGYLKERSPFAAPMSLDWQSVVSRHLDEVITDISHWQFATDTQRLLKRPEVKDAIIDRLGQSTYKNLLDWVRYTVNQDNVSPEASDSIEKFRRSIRGNMSTYVLDFKVMNAVNELAIGMPLMMQQVKVASAFKGIMQYMRNPVAATSFANDASDHMRNVDKSFDRDISQALNSLVGKHSVVDDIKHWSIASRTFFWKIGAVMAWHAGYIDAQEQGLQGKAAVGIADSIYRMTQESGRAGDFSAVQRNPYMKELTQFIGPSLIQYNNLRRSAMAFKDQGINTDTATLGLKTLFAGYVANSIIFGMLRGQHPDNLEKLPAWILAKLSLGMFDGFPVMRDIVGYAESKITGEKGKEPRLSPVLQWGKDAVDGVTKTVQAMAGNEDWNKAIIQDAKAPGGATGLATLAGSTVGQYIFDVLSGDYKPEHPWSPVADIFYNRKK